MARFDSGGVGLHYVDRGSGGPVVLLHGFTSSFAGTWERTGWAELLLHNGRRVVGLDFPSHGESDPVYEPERCSPAALTADLVALVDHLRLEGVDLIGFSLASPTLLFIAGRDQYMAGTGAIESWLTHAEVVRFANHDHHSILRDDELQQHAGRWLCDD